jgi:glycosyltransferase involved in cell wall biosynthesis
MLICSDACIVSTPAISYYVRENYRIDAHILHNKIEPIMLRSNERVNDRYVRLLYSSGTLSHKEDFILIEAALFEFLSTKSDVALNILGAAQVSERILALPNAGSYPVMPYCDMLDFVAQHDVLLVPLAESQFNTAKSYVKFLEAAAVGVPVVASRIGEFKRCVRNGENGVLVDSNRQWSDALDWIYRNRGSLRELGTAAQQDLVRWGLTTTFRDGEIDTLRRALGFGFL